MNPPRSRWEIGLLLFMISFLGNGCSQYLGSSGLDQARTFKEPEGGGSYELYKPSYYTRDRFWPLVVVCHDAGPWDSPRGRIQEWARLAQTKGFIVAAPRLKYSGLSSWASAEKRGEALREDERHVLGVVHHARGAYRVSEDRIFIHGWRVGAAPALYVGLRHPEVFRAVAAGQPQFDVSEWAGLEMTVDPHQPVLVRRSISDKLTGDRAGACVEWLRARQVDLKDDLGKVRTGVPDRAVDFFEHVLASKPLARIRALPSDSDNPLEVRFQVHASFEPRTYAWDFGDGESSPVSEPVHAYSESGAYQVVVRISDADRRTLTRTSVIHVPWAD